MSRIAPLLVLLVLAPGVALADDTPTTEPADETKATQPEPEPESEPASKTETGPKVISGMSILGNQEAPKALVIVPWKSSELGESIGISSMLDDSRLPVDRDVFLRALGYYEIRAESTP